jgi:uncharacterized protein
MMVVLTALGLVLVIEGLAFALAPSRIEDALRWLAGIPVDARRSIGLAMVAAGVVVVWITRA